MNHVDPVVALAAMTKLWRSFGNEISSPLLSSWQSMCDAFNQAGLNGCSTGWTALAMPTGIGKTQFAALYCALMPNPVIDLSNLRSVKMHPGVLFVTRFTNEADNFAALVNKYAGKRVAAAYHHKSGLTLAQAEQYPVLAISHVACEKYQLNDSGSTSGQGIWRRLSAWQQGVRAKVIIDETPNFITPVQIKQSALSQTLGSLKWTAGKDKRLYDDLETLLECISDARHPNKNRVLDCGEYDLLASMNTHKMREHLASVPDYALALDVGSTSHSLRSVCKNTLSAIEALQRNQWGWVSYRGGTAEINSASLHPSLRTGGGVILDGTAELYVGYAMLSPPVKIISAAANIRSYDSVTVHVARGHKAGKAYLTENAAKLWGQYKPAIEAQLPNSERVLICTHKSFREQVSVGQPARFSFAHYGMIDGRNDWQDYEAVALLGLPYLDSVTPSNVAQSLLGVQKNDWLQCASLRQFEEHADVLTTLQQGHMSTSVVQAINRVRCRNAIDSAGRCRLTTVFLALPTGQDGDAVLAAVVKTMPGIQIKTWDVDTAKRKPRTVPASETLVAFFTAAPPGVYSKANVRTAAGIAPSSLDRIIKRMNIAASPERGRLDELHVTYYTQSGKGAESYFVKT